MPAPTCFGCRRIVSEAPGGKGRPNYSLRRPMSALSAGNSNSRCSMTASSTLGRWHENPDQVHPPERTMHREQKESPRLTSGARTDETSRGRTLDAPKAPDSRLGLELTNHL